MHWLVCRCHQGGKLPWPTPSTLPSPPQCSHWHLQSISFILKRHRSHSKGNFWRDLFGKDVLKWNIEAGPLPGTHSRNRQPVSGASAVPFFCPPFFPCTPLVPSCPPLPLPPITILLSPSPHYPIITQPTATLRSINSSPGSVQERVWITCAL